MLAKVEDISFHLGKESYVHKLDTSHISNIHECQIFPTIVNENESSDLFSTRIEYLGPENPAIIIHNIGKNESKNQRYDLKVGWIVVGFGFKSYLNIKFDGNEVQIKKANEKKSVATIERPGSEVGLIGTCIIESYKKPNCDPESSKIITNLHFHETQACIYIDNIDDKKKNIEFLDHLSTCYR